MEKRETFLNFVFEYVNPLADEQRFFSYCILMHFDARNLTIFAILAPYRFHLGCKRISRRAGSPADDRFAS